MVQNIKPIQWIMLMMGLVVLSCQSNKDQFLFIDKIAEFHCEAKKLKDTRFKTADSLRFYQDSLRLFPEEERRTVWQSKVDQYLVDKERLAAESRSLADSIRQYLNMSTANMTPEDKRKFNEVLQSKSEALNCSN